MGTLLCIYLQLFEQMIAIAPFLIASEIYFSPLILFGINVS